MSGSVPPPLFFRLHFSNGNASRNSFLNQPFQMFTCFSTASNSLHLIPGAGSLESAVSCQLDPSICRCPRHTHTPPDIRTSRYQGPNIKYLKNVKKHQNWGSCYIPKLIYCTCNACITVCQNSCNQAIDIRSESNLLMLYLQIL